MKKTLLLALFLFISCNDTYITPILEKEITICSNQVLLEGLLFINEKPISKHYWSEENNYTQYIKIQDNKNYLLQYWTPNNETKIKTLELNYNMGNLSLFNIFIDPSVDEIEDEIIFEF
jgi:hypothetical protein